MHFEQLDRWREVVPLFQSSRRACHKALRWVVAVACLDAIHGHIFERVELVALLSGHQVNVLPVLLGVVKLEGLEQIRRSEQLRPFSDELASKASWKVETEPLVHMHRRLNVDVRSRRVVCQRSSLQLLADGLAHAGWSTHAFAFGVLWS